MIAFGTASFLVAAVITNAAALQEACERYGKVGEKFDVTVTVTAPTELEKRSIYVEDPSGAAQLHTLPDALEVQVGDVIHAQGTICATRFKGLRHAYIEQAELLSSGNPHPEPASFSIPELLDRKNVNRLVKMQGIVCEVFRDDIDAAYIYFVVEDRGERFCATLRTKEGPEKYEEMYLNRAVEMIGNCSSDLGRRFFIDNPLHLNNPLMIRKLDENRVDPYSSPDVFSLSHSTAHEITSKSQHVVRGRVLASWDQHRVLIESTNHWSVTAWMTNGELPRIGDEIEVVGYPQTDLYNINLNHAMWRRMEKPLVYSDQRDELEEEDLEIIPGVSPAVQHAHVVEVRGRIYRRQEAPGKSPRYFLDCNGENMEIVLSGAAEDSFVEINSIAKIRGRCLIEAEPWSKNNIVPRVAAFSILVTSAADIEILKGPPWWTPIKLVLLLAIAAVVILAVVLWNFILRRDAKMRLSERSRLAAELHDSVAQNLSGVSLQIDAAAALAHENAAKSADRLAFASKALKSSREELRNCIWDLRNNALDCPTFNEAIRKVLSTLPVENLKLRFSVAKSGLSDTLVHTVLSIIRELVSNAVRHAGARTIKIAGSEDEWIRFSVADDGEGFDIGNVPGIREGHFGLSGIRERLRQFEGTMDIESVKGKGTKVTVKVWK